MSSNVKLDDVQNVVAREAELEAMLVSLMSAPLAPFRTSLEELDALLRSQHEEIRQTRRALSAALDEVHEGQKKALQRSVAQLEGVVEEGLGRANTQLAPLGTKLDGLAVALAQLAMQVDACAGRLTDEVAVLKRDVLSAKRRVTWWAAATGVGFAVSASIAVWALFGGQ